MTAKINKVLLLGASGTAGSACLVKLRQSGFVVAPVLRRQMGYENEVVLDLTDVDAIHDYIVSEKIDAVVSCLASRTGLPDDAWAVDFQLNRNVLQACAGTRVTHFTILSAICVQKPKLEFQKAKLAFEAALMSCGIPYSIVRPTAFFKSLSGQIERVQIGKPILVFGDGKSTSCKPISDDDLGQYLTNSLTDPNMKNKILPIGGPGPTLTPLDQAQLIFDATGQPNNVKKVPIGMMKAIVGMLSFFGLFSGKIKSKAELARIGYYYATESMLVWDDAKNQYDADATPEFGSDRLVDHYKDLVAGNVTHNLGDHAVFKNKKAV